MAVNKSEELTTEAKHFYNNNIKIGKTTIFYGNWVKKGVCTIGGLLDENGSLLSYQSFHEKHVIANTWVWKAAVLFVIRKNIIFNIYFENAHIYRHYGKISWLP